MKKELIVILILVVVVGGIGAVLLFKGKNAYKTEPVEEAQTTPFTPGVIEEQEKTEVEEAERTGEVAEISMVSGNFFFEPKNLNLQKDKPIRIKFKNTGVHTFTIDELGVNVQLKNSEEIAEFTPTRSGAFRYYCAIPGHTEAGMFGSLKVQ